MKSFLALALVVLFVAHNIAGVRAGDFDPLQDFCVADKASGVNVNGFPCKDASMVTANDFMFRGLDIAGDTSNMLGSNITVANVMQIPGLNTLGISMVRIDYAAPLGLNHPHTHPQATKMLVVMEGTLSVGFITNANKFFSKTLEKGDVFVFPKGLVHFQQNVGYGNAVAIAALSSQLPGTHQVAQSLFGASPPLDASLLAKAFKIDASLVKLLQTKFLAA